MHRILSSILTLTTLGAFAQMSVQAQKGTISGSVSGQENGQVQPLPFVNVVIKGTAIGATTDMDGRFSFHAEAGTHLLLVSFVGYEPIERPVSVEPGETTAVNVELSNRAVEMKAMDVVTVRRIDTEGAVNMDTRRSEQLVNGVGRQQIARGQDRTAGDVMKRIPGVTVVNDRFVMIRGLADRYNTVLLNGVTAPSLEPDKRAFSFDLIPSGALDRVMIYKTGAPELPGEFAGGIIKISTISVPAENETRVSYGTAYRVGTTFQGFHQDHGSATDFLGFDNGFRALPETFPARLSYVNDPEQLAALGRELPNNWVAQERTALPDQRFGLLLSRRFGKEGGTSYGNITSIDYSNTFQAYEAETWNFNAYDLEAQRSDTIYKYVDAENLHTARVSVLHNWTALIGRSKLEFRNLFNQIGENRATLRTGQNLEEGFDVRNYAYRWQQRTIYSGQLSGSHDLKPEVDKLEWTLGYSMALSKEPDLRRIRTTRDIEQSDSDAPFQTVIPPSASTQDAARFYSDLNEGVITGRVDYEHAMTCHDGKIETKLRGGLMAERKDRSFEARWMSFTRANIASFDQSLLYAPLDEVFTDANINTTNGFELEEGTNPSDRYSAANTLLAGYLGATVTLNKLVTISGGARVEHNTQELSSATFGGNRVEVDQQVTNVLPSLNASWNITERALIRLAWSNTVNRPEFRELAPFSFYDFSTNTTLYGNPDSLVSARIMNLDARWEFYPSTSEMISAGVFYKDFTDPIEMFFVPGTGSGGTRNFTFANAAHAKSLGAEVEVRRSLNMIFPRGPLARLGVLVNATVIKSEVDLGSKSVGQERQRPMTGQSPYVANAGIYYSHPEGKVQVSLLYNIFGRRLHAVGTGIVQDPVTGEDVVGTPDVYEMPRHSLDATFSKGWGEHFELKLGVQDILDQETLMQQDSDSDGTIETTDERILSYRRGTVFNAGFSYRF